MRLFHCLECDGSGGDDDGPCAVCDGSGNATCEKRGCTEHAVGFNDDGKALCEDCIAEWMSELQDEMER